MLKIRTANKKGWMEGHPGDGLVLNFIGRARGVARNQKSPTIQTDGGGSTGVITMDYRIRKLTEKECLRLMGFSDPEINKLVDARNDKDKPVFSRTVLYRFAGNSVVVDCYKHIMDTIIDDMEKPITTLDDF